MPSTRRCPQQLEYSTVWRLQIMIILATRAFADAMIGCWAVLFDAALGPRGQKDDDAAVPLDVALERARRRRDMDRLI